MYIQTECARTRLYIFLFVVVFVRVRYNKGTTAIVAAYWTQRANSGVGILTS